MHERLQFEVGHHERHWVEFDFDRTWGPIKVRVDGHLADTGFTMFSVKLTKRFEFTVGQHERHHVVIEKRRKLLFAGFRPSTYKVFIDGQLALTHEG